MGVEDAFNHGEQRVLEHLVDALADAEPWWKQTIKDNPAGPCDACLTGRASLLGPTGQLPQDEGMLYIDFYHCNVPAIFTGNTARLAENGIFSAGMRHPPPAVRCRPGKHPTMNLTDSVTMSLQPSGSKQI